MMSSIYPFMSSLSVEEHLVELYNTHKRDERGVYDQFDIYFSALKDAGKLYSGMNPTAFFLWAHSVNGGLHASAHFDFVGVEVDNDEFKVVDILTTDALVLCLEKVQIKRELFS